MFDNARDANQYLSGTVCYWDGNPIYVDHVDGAFNAIGYNLPMKARGENPLIRADVRDRRFNCREFNLGYVNLQSYGQAFYMSRVPHRGVQQGLCDANVMFEGRPKDPAKPPPRLRNILTDPGFAAMLRGTYPTPAEAADQLGKSHSVAFSAELCVKKHPRFSNLRFLEYRGREVSFSETLTFKLPDEFRYLQESCEPHGVLERN